MKIVGKRKVKLIIIIIILAIVLVGLLSIWLSYRISTTNSIKQKAATTPVYYDSNCGGGKVPIPNGFYYVGGNLNNGIIISDSSADKYDGRTDKTTYAYSKKLKGNQFVWIPCTEANYKSTTWPAYAGKGQGDPPSATASDRELAQIRKYGGFYVGRYEAGLPDAMEYKDTMYPKSQNYNKSGKPLSQANKIPWMYISWPKAKDNAISMYSGNQYVQSGMITDIQFDVILNTLKNRAGVGDNAIRFNSSEWANYWTAYTHSYNGRVAVYNGHHDASAGFVLDYMHPFSGTQTGSTIDHEYVAQQTGEYPTTAELLSTGASADFMKYHIFDLAGNVWDMTESGTARGSCMVNSYTYFNATYRTGTVGNSVSPQFGFRVVLYINRTYDVKFNSNGGTPTPGTQTVLAGAKATKPANPTKTGYTFKQWNKQGTNTAYDFNTAVNSDITLVAQWTEKTANLSYNANGHGTAPASVTMKYTTATNAATAISAAGYTFDSWNTKANGSGTKYTAGAQVKAANKEPSAITLYAQWKPRTDTRYKINHYKKNASGGYDTEKTETKQGITDSTVTATPIVISGYLLDKNHSGSVLSGKIKGDGSLVLKLYYDPDVATGEMASDTKVQYYNSNGDIVSTVTFKAKKNEFKRRGYKFGKWLNGSITGEEIAEGDNVPFNPPVTSTETTKTLYAKWIYVGD